MATAEQIAAWQRLTETAAAWTEAKEDRKARDALHHAAIAYGKATAPKPGVVTSAGGRTLRSGKTIPFGRSKGMAIEEAETKDLSWVAGALRESIDDPKKERWRADNVELLSAIEAELEGR